MSDLVEVYVGGGGRGGDTQHAENIRERIPPCRHVSSLSTDAHMVRYGGTGRTPVAPRGAMNSGRTGQADREREMDIKGRKWPSVLFCTTVMVTRGVEDTESRTQQQPFVCLCVMPFFFF